MRIYYAVVRNEFGQNSVQVWNTQWHIISPEIVSIKVLYLSVTKGSTFADIDTYAQLYK